MDVRDDARAARPAPLPASEVIVVDDSELVREQLAGLLEYDGFSVAQADCGETALEAMRARPPDLIVLDWQMPGMDGLEVCRRIRTAGCRAYVVIYTSRDERGDGLRAEAAGADALVSKLEPPEALVQLLRQARERLARDGR